MKQSMMERIEEVEHINKKDELFKESSSLHDLYVPAVATPPSHFVIYTYIHITKYTHLCGKTKQQQFGWGRHMIRPTDHRGPPPT